jgi:16S rRNA (cytidine1402-2'-O)-methyltransferase
MSGTLFLVATPIGNLEDITLRALRVLREADLIAAEDTRRTAILLGHHGISTHTISFHEHNTRTRVPQIVGRLKSGARVALVSDAGTPGISDPGQELVEACVREGVAVDPIPGANAHITAAVASGFPLEPLTVFGFPPHKEKARAEWLQAIAGVKNTVVFLESPHRIGATLAHAAMLLGNRPIMLGRELTKAHQEFIRGTADELARRTESARGEFTVVVGPSADVSRVEVVASDAEIARVFGETTERGLSDRRTAISETAKRLGIPKRHVYSAVERSKHSG